MTDKKIKEQVRAIERVTKSASVSKASATAFLQSAGIFNTQREEKKNSRSSSKNK